VTNEILLVDDEEGIRIVLGIALEESGYRVLTAGSGEEALSSFRRHAPAIVVADIKMPGMDGIELLKKIKEEAPDTEVIMITGHGDMEMAVESLQCDATDFVTKPIDDEALEVALKRAREHIEIKKKLQEYTESLERMVEEKTRELLAAERLACIGQTVETIAHSIKNILGGLTGGMFVLEKGIELRNTQYLDEGWRMTRGNVDKIKNLALDLLNYGKEREPNLSLIDPNAPLRDVFHLMASKAAECRTDLLLNPCDTLPGSWMDPEGIHCALLNLVTNALDACTDVDSAPGRKAVVLGSSRVHGWAVEYQVSDNGCGMDDALKEKTFKGFYTTKGSRGTGLGLMIAQKIIKEHGGTIGMESERGKGTKFTIRIPVIERPSAP
jgi:signal transduction histidine kinase